MLDRLLISFKLGHNACRECLIVTSAGVTLYDEIVRRSAQTEVTYVSIVQSLSIMTDRTDMQNEEKV